jgi:phospholipase C
MAKVVEKTYGKVFKYVLLAANPFKKSVIVTSCKIHKFINLQALEILKNDNYRDASTFFYDYIVNLNEGVVWADQDFRSTGHFYNPMKKRGLYGNKNALSLAVEYYSKALTNWKEGKIEDSMFFLGAAVHLVQDMTVPQHANIRLLDNHRQYENYIKKAYKSSPEFVTHRGGYYVDSIEEAVKCNARVAMKIYSKLRYIHDDLKRYHTIAKFTLPLAQKTTAGCFLRFYKDTGRIHKVFLRNGSKP